MAKIIKITDECVTCGACEGSCPTMAISLTADKSKYEIDVEKCVQCYNCVNLCPVAAIIDEPVDKN